MIKLILGPMRAGKSLILLREAEKLNFSKKSYCIIRPKLDTRDFISRSFKPAVSLNISRNYNDIVKYDNILMDEFHLFEEEIVEQVIELSKNKNFILSGLNNGSNNLEKPLNIEILKNIARVIPFSEEILKLNAICEKCGSQYGNYMVTEKITISDDYTVLCRQCRTLISGN